MKNVVNFLVVTLAVLFALFLYDKFRSSRASGDFGAGEIQVSNDLIRSDVNRAFSPAKTAVAEFYANRQTWPDSNQGTGLPEPESYRGESLRRLEVAGNTVTLTFDQRSGVDGGQIVMTGDASNPAMSVGWKCTSPNLPNVAAALPGCTYTPR